MPSSMVYYTSGEAEPHLNTILGPGNWRSGLRARVSFCCIQRTTGSIDRRGDGRDCVPRYGRKRSRQLFLTVRDGLILRSSDFGSTWFRVESGTAAGLFSIKWTSAAVVAVGGGRLAETESLRNHRAASAFKGVSRLREPRFYWPRLCLCDRFFTATGWTYPPTPVLPEGTEGRITRLVGLRHSLISFRLCSCRFARESKTNAVRQSRISGGP